MSIKNKGTSYRNINIDAGHTMYDAELACNELVSQCQNNAGCDALSTTRWRCKLKSDKSDKGFVDIWEGHTKGDAEWACDNFLPECNGGCDALYTTKWDCRTKMTTYQEVTCIFGGVIRKKMLNWHVIIITQDVKITEDVRQHNMLHNFRLRCLI